MQNQLLIYLLWYHLNRTNKQYYAGCSWAPDFEYEKMLTRSIEISENHVSNHASIHIIHILISLFQHFTSRSWKKSLHSSENLFLIFSNSSSGEGIFFKEEIFYLSFRKNLFLESHILISVNWKMISSAVLCLGIGSIIDSHLECSDCSRVNKEIKVDKAGF